MGKMLDRTFYKLSTILWEDDNGIRVSTSELIDTIKNDTVPYKIVRGADCREKKIKLERALYNADMVRCKQNETIIVG